MGAKYGLNKKATSERWLKPVLETQVFYFKGEITL